MSIKRELFVEQPNIDVKVGIQVTDKTEFTYCNEKLEQTLKNLVLETMLEEEGTNGINTYNSKSYIRINLNEGDILLFDENRGYYMSPFPVESIEDAIGDIESLRGIKLNDEVNEV